jgi:hypothetical protein
MNLHVLPSLTANGTDQAVEVPRGYVLAIHATAAAELRHVASGPAFPIPADTIVCLGESLGQTVYVRATAGTVISLALN